MTRAPLLAMALWTAPWVAASVATAQDATRVVRVQVVGCDAQPVEAIRRIASIELREPVEVSAEPGVVRIECEGDVLRVVVGRDARELSTLDVDSAVLARLVALSIVESLRASQSAGAIAASEDDPRTDEGHDPPSAPPLTESEPPAESPPQEGEDTVWPRLSLSLQGEARGYVDSGAVLGGGALALGLRIGLLSLGLAARAQRGAHRVQLGEVEMTLAGGAFHLGLAGDAGPFELMADVGISVEAVELVGRADDEAGTLASSGWAPLVCARLMAAARWRFAAPFFLVLRVGADLPIQPLRAGIDETSAATLQGAGLWAGGGLGADL